ncbi:MAG: polysaccharide pyruvyl transferase family protein, partial [Lentisphaeria bacterium]|nr:polysaccharide pyruvyl transferase family protein [Lentisphaeria bacterium]
MKTVLLRGSWQTKNIGDIAHTPGFLNLAKKYLPEASIWLWPCQIDRGVREMLLANFPGLRLVESEAEIQ